MPDARGSLVRRVAALLVSIGLTLSLGCTTDTLVRPSAGGTPVFSTVPPGTTETLVASGLQSPTAMAITPDGRVFVNEQCGDIRVIKNGALLAADLLDVATDCTGERGVLGVAVDPDFANTQKLYVYYTVPGASLHNRISVFTVSGDKVVAGSEQVLFDLDPLTADYHNGGVLHFGPDGKLYVGVGENGNSANSQSMTTVLGKILRLNPDGSIPADNPFFSTTTGNNRAIWALGLRNPWTFGFQAGTGRLFIDDVGEVTYEEINDGVAGANYGWPTCEGPCTPTQPGLKDPLYFYPHVGTCAITGGTFYNPTTARLPASWYGQYFFVDYCEGIIRAIDPSSKVVSTFSSGLSFPVDLQVSNDGFLYYLQRGLGNGQVWRVDGTASQAPIITQQPTSLLVSVGQGATFTVAASGSGTLSYQWQRGTTDIPDATAPTYTLATTVQGDSGATFRCIVSSTFGSTPSNAAVLSVTSNQPPSATITTPMIGATYVGGQTINFSATASDPETGALPASAFSWQVLLHHDSHTHPFFPPTSGITSGSFVIPTNGEVSANVYYMILLTVTDPAGLSQTFERDVIPQTSTFTIQTVPGNAQFLLDGQPATAPLSVLGVVGIQRTLGAVSPQVIGSTTYNFSSWSDGGAASHVIATPAAATTYTATYAAQAPPTTITFVQATAATKTAASNALAFPASTTAGDLIVVGVNWIGNATFTGMTDNQGDVFTQVGAEVATSIGIKARMYYAPNIHGGATTVTATLSASSSSLQLYIGQYHGASQSAPLDASAQRAGSGSSATAGPMTTTALNDELVAFCASEASCNAASGYSTRSTHSGNLFEDRALTTPGSITAAATSTANWALVAGAFRPQASGPPPTPVTATVTAADKVYNGTAAATITSCTLSGSPAGVTCSAGSAAFADPAAGSNKTVTATGIALAGVNAGSYTLTSTTAITTASITTAPMTASVVAASKLFDGTTTATITACTLGGNPAGVTCSAAAAAFADPAIGTGKTVTATGITLAGANAGNYALTSTTATTTADITSGVTTVTASVTAANKVFNGTTAATITGCTLSGNPTGVTCSAASAAFADASAGTGKTVTATGISLGGPKAGNYTLGSTTATALACITPLPVSPSITAADKPYDGTTAATLTGCTVTGNPSGITCSAVSATFSSAAVGTGKTVTATGLTLVGSGSTNYSLTGTTATTTASITRAPVTATVTAADKVFDGTTTATVTGCALSGTPVNLTCSAASAAFADPAVGAGKTVTASGLTLGGSNAGNYILTSTTATTSASILPPPTPVTASVTAADKVYNGTTAATITGCTLSGSPTGVTCSASAATFATATVGTGKTVTATGIALGGPNAGGYALTSTTATTTASITPQPVTATVAAANKVFDGTTSATITSCTLSGSPAGVTCSAAAASFADPAIGTGKPVTATGLTLGGTNAVNYALTSTTATTTASITATATAVSFVQVAAGTKVAASNALALPSSTAAGDLIVVGVDWIGSATFATITDNQGNVFTQVGSQLATAGGVKARLYYAKAIKGGAETVTVTLSGSDPSLQVYIAQYHGANAVAPLDASAQAIGTTSSVSSGAMTATVTGDMILGYCVSEASCTQGSGFAARSTHSGNLLEDRALTATGSFSATGTSGARWAMLAAALRP